MSTSEVLDKLDKALAFGMETPEAMRAMVAVALAELNNYHAEFPFYRMTDNQQLDDSEGNGIPDGWSFGANIACEVAGVIEGYQTWADRTDIEKEFMTAAGAENFNKWGDTDANIWRLSWDLTQDQFDNGGGANYLIYITARGFTTATCRALSKLESGAVVADKGFLAGISESVSITGQTVTSNARYFNQSVAIDSLSGSLLIALPAVVAGIHPDDRWGFFGGKSEGVA